jgi:hypothetical protein
MIKEIALSLAEREDVYLTSEGKKALQDIINEKGTGIHVPSNR